METYLFLLRFGLLVVYLDLGAVVHEEMVSIWFEDIITKSVTEICQVKELVFRGDSHREELILHLLGSLIDLSR